MILYFSTHSLSLSSLHLPHPIFSSTSPISHLPLLLPTVSSELHAQPSLPELVLLPQQDMSHLHTNYHLLSHICQNMELYMRKARAVAKSKWSHIYTCTCTCTLYIRSDIENCEAWLSPGGHSSGGHSSGGRALTAKVRGPVQSQVAAGFSQLSKNVPKLFLMYIHVHVHTCMPSIVCMYIHMPSIVCICHWFLYIGHSDQWQDLYLEVLPYKDRGHFKLR